MPSDSNPSPTPSPSGKQRRRSNPPVGGNWIWIVIFLVLVGMLLANSLNPGGSLEWSEFWTLMEKGNLKRVVLVGTDRITGEVKNLEEFTKKLEADGIKLTVPYRKVPALGIAIAFINDPWGTNIELTEGLDKVS